MNLHDWLPEVSLTRVDCFSGSLITHLDSQRESQRESSPGVSTIDTESADEEWVPGAGVYWNKMPILYLILSCLYAHKNI